MPKFAANLMFMFTERPLPERFAAAARGGFKAVEFLVPFDHSAADLARWLRAHDLVNVGFNMWPGQWAEGERGIASLPGREAEFRQSVTQALEYADRMGTPQFHPLAGLVPPGGDRAAHRRVYIENLKYAAAAAAPHGRSIAIETLNQRDMPGYFLSSLAEAEAIRQEVGAPNLTLQMDFYHVQVAEGDLLKKFAAYQPHISHVQIAGVPDRHEPDEGEVSYPYLLQQMDALGYAGWVGCEYRPRGRTEDGLAWMKTFAGA